MRTTLERIKRIQRALDLEPDGVIGAQTLTALEEKLRISFEPDVNPARVGRAESSTPVITLSKAGLDAIIAHEVSSEAYYNARLKAPIWPGASSGVTIGIGYDLGYVSTEDFISDWQVYLSSADLAKLTAVVGLTKSRAQRKIKSLKRISIDYQAARQVFVKRSLLAYASKTLAAYPGLQLLKPDAQSALVSLVYNRGASLSGSRRAEMAAIKPLVQEQDYRGIAEQILKMKRLWAGRGLTGLLKRRDDEAAMVAGAQRSYLPDELVQVVV